MVGSVALAMQFVFQRLEQAGRSKGPAVPPSVSQEPWSIGQGCPTAHSVKLKHIMQMHVNEIPRSCGFINDTK